MTATTVDGRHLRREQNREAVLAALGELFAENNLQPSTGEIAERAGISARSLFRYFDDVDDLHRAAIDQQLARAAPLRRVPASPDDPLAHRIEQVVATRVRLFEAIEPAARAARAAAHRRPLVAAQLTRGRTYLRKQVTDLFAAELVGDRAALLPALDALLSFETHQLLRVDQRLSKPSTTSTLISAVTALLQGDHR